MSTNQLHRATSPYLLQHKDNPVHWREWGDEALDHAKATGKPILLSIGYAACHWCHVMAHESFEDEETAGVMNALFVNIKVDREERPDIDHIYMSALHALGEQGGWPLTMFLGSDTLPFWGGTYFPKEARYGRPSFVSVLKQVATTYRDKGLTIQRNKAALMEAITAARPPAERESVLTPAGLNNIATQIASAMDRHLGGLAGAPKFPNTPILELLLRGAGRLHSRDMEDLVILTLTQICRGGIYDHLGGGFARYSVDAEWLVPHFEKMLYDNAQLLELLALAYRSTDDALFRRAAEQTVGWLQREMTLAGGAFCASLDADSDGVEGRYYIWTAAEIDTVLEPEEVRFFARFYDITPNGNWHDEHTGESVSILNRLKSPPATEDEEQRLAPLRDRLLAHRAKRNRPGLDDKVLSDWNGLMIAALVHAAPIFDRPEWLAMAIKAFDDVTRIAGASEPRDEPLLIHARRGDRSGAVALAADYAAMIRAALALHEATSAEDPGARGSATASRFLEKAVGWVAVLERHYVVPGHAHLFMASDQAQDLPARLAPTQDDATANANGLYAASLIRLAAHTGDVAYLRRADALIDSAKAEIAANPFAHCSLLNALDLRLNGVEVVAAGTDPLPFARAALRTSFLNRTLVVVGADGLAKDHVAAAQIRAAGAGAAFVCRAGACSPPVTDPDRLAAAVDAA